MIRETLAQITLEKICIILQVELALSLLILGAFFHGEETVNIPKSVDGDDQGGFHSFFKWA